MTTEVIADSGSEVIVGRLNRKTGHAEGSSGTGSVISAIASVSTGTGSTVTGAGFGAITGSMALAGAAAFLAVGTYLAISGFRTGASLAVYMDTAKLRAADVYWYFS